MKKDRFGWQPLAGPRAVAVRTFLGDGSSNMAHSYLLGGATAGMQVRIGAQEAFTTPTRLCWKPPRGSPRRPAAMSADVIDGPKRP